MQRELRIDLLLSRMSVRRFMHEAVSDDVICRITDVAKYAPSAKNSQLWEFIVVKDSELRSKLASIHLHAQPIRQAAVAVVVICDPAKVTDLIHA